MSFSVLLPLLAVAVGAVLIHSEANGDLPSHLGAYPPCFPIMLGSPVVCFVAAVASNPSACVVYVAMTLANCGVLQP